jgi:hypothetical protein
MRVVAIVFQTVNRLGRNEIDPANILANQCAFANLSDNILPIPNVGNLSAIDSFRQPKTIGLIRIRNLNAVFPR